MSNEHVMFAEEPAYGTWTTPDKAIPVRSMNLTGNQPLMIPEETGGGRGDLPGAVGEVSVGPGDITGLLRPKGWGWLLRSAFGIRAVTTTGLVNRNKFLIDDDIDPETFSFQKRFKPTLAESIKGSKLAGFTISARTREFAMITTSWVGKDSVASGSAPGTWADGSAAPAVVDPVPYASPQIEAFKFYQGVMRLGGTLTLVDGELVVTGGTARGDLDNIEIGMNLNPSTDAYGVNLGDRTLQDIPLGRREITARFDPNFGASGAEFYNGWKAGSRAVVELYFRGPVISGADRHEMKITLPWVIYSAGGMPELNAQYGLKRHTVEGRAFLDDALGADIGLVIQTTEDLVT